MSMELLIELHIHSHPFYSRFANYDIYKYVSLGAFGTKGGFKRFRNKHASVLQRSFFLSSKYKYIWSSVSPSRVLHFYDDVDKLYSHLFIEKEGTMSSTCFVIFVAELLSHWHILDLECFYHFRNLLLMAIFVSVKSFYNFSLTLDQPLLRHCFLCIAYPAFRLIMFIFCFIGLLFDLIPSTSIDYQFLVYN